MARKRWITYKIADIEPERIEEFNSTNAWGFAGSVGIRVHYPNGTEITIAKAYYRHLSPTAYITVKDKDGYTVVDSNGISFNKISEMPSVIAAVAGKEIES